MTYAIKIHVPAHEPVSIEQLAAADLVMHARRAEKVSADLGADERELYAKRYELLIEGLRRGVDVMRRGAPDPTFIPEYLRSENAAAFHD